MTLDVSQLDLSAIESMSDEELDALAGDLGVAGEEGDGQESSEEGAAAEGSSQEEVGDPETTPQSQSQATPRGQDIIELFKSSPEAQELVRNSISRTLQEASAKAEAQKEQEEFKQLLESGDYAEIGRRYVQTETERSIRSKVEDEATTKAYAEVYGGLFRELDKLNLPPEDKAKTTPEAFGVQTDADYVLALSQFISDRKAGVNIEAEVKRRTEENLLAIKNERAARAAKSTSVSALPGAVEGASGERASSKSLIAEGLRELLDTHQQRAAEAMG